MHVRIRIDSLRISRFIGLSAPIRIYTIDCRVDYGETHSYIYYKLFLMIKLIACHLHYHLRYISQKQFLLTF